jgi:hypothetical protein
MRPDTSAITRSSSRKETAASLFFITAIALGDVRVFPIRNGLRSIRPYGSGKHATLKIVDRYAYLARCQDVDRFCELFPIIHRVNPQEFVIGNRKPGVFQAHQRDVVNEWQISREPLTCGDNSRSRNGVQHNANFDALSDCS